jgi:hypothetical protein
MLSINFPPLPAKVKQYLIKLFKGGKKKGKKIIIAKDN